MKQSRMLECKLSDTIANTCLLGVGKQAQSYCQLA